LLILESRRYLANYVNYSKSFPLVVVKALKNPTSKEKLMSRKWEKCFRGTEDTQTW